MTNLTDHMMDIQLWTKLQKTNNAIDTYINDKFSKHINS